MRRAIVALLALWLCATVGGGSVLAAPLDGAVTGEVANGSRGGASPAGDQVALLVFGVKEQAALDQRTATVGADGRYSFDGLDRDPNLVYYLVVQHQGVSYSDQQPFQFKDGASHQSNVTVYDATDDDTAIRLERVNLLVAGVQPGMAQLFQMGALVNDGDRTFVSPNPQEGALAKAVKFGLPKGALNVQMQTGFSDEDVLPSVTGVQVAAPLTPGRHEFALSFQLPYQQAAADLTLQVPYAADTFNVYVPGGGLRLEGSTLQAQGNAPLGGQTYALFSANAVRRDSVMAARLAGLPSPAAESSLSPNQLALMSLGAVLLVLGAGVLLFSLRRPRGPVAAPAVADPVIEAAELEEERLRLVVRLAALDERHAAGDIGDGEYRAERERGKRRLVELTRLARAAG